MLISPAGIQLEPSKSFNNPSVVLKYIIPSSVAPNPAGSNEADGNIIPLFEPINTVNDAEGWLGAEPESEPITIWLPINVWVEPETVKSPVTLKSPSLTVKPPLFKLREPLWYIEPVNWCVSVISSPKMLEPVAWVIEELMKVVWISSASILPVTVRSFCIVTLPAKLEVPSISRLPVADKLPLALIAPLAVTWVVAAVPNCMESWLAST